MNKKEKWLEGVWSRRLAAVFAGLLLMTASCSIEQQEMPLMDGPSTFGISLLLTATPDILRADGTSTSAIGITLRGPDGEPLSDRQIVISLADPSGYFAEVGMVRPELVTTDQGGRAAAIYTAPVRTDHAWDGYVLVMARPISTDYAGELYRSVRIELRAAETGRFPHPPGLSCGFVIEPATGPYYVGVWYPMQSTAGGDIIRFEWNFGDGSRDEKPDTIHAYRTAGEYTITHVVTDRTGAQAGCEASITVQ